MRDATPPHRPGRMVQRILLKVIRVSAWEGGFTRMSPYPTLNWRGWAIMATMTSIRRGSLPIPQHLQVILNETQSNYQLAIIALLEAFHTAPIRRARSRRSVTQRGTSATKTCFPCYVSITRRGEFFAHPNF